MSLETALIIMTVTGLALLFVPWFVRYDNEHGLHLARLVILLVVAVLVLAYWLLVTIRLPHVTGGATP